MAPPLVLLSGPAFSGKSTLAAHLAARWGFEVVSLDAINARRGLRGGEGVPEAEWARTAALARDEVRALLSLPGSRVVVDDTLCFRFLRNDFRGIATEAGRDSVLLVLGTSIEDVRRRISENERRPTRGGIREVVLEQHLAAFEWPGVDEPHRVVRDVADLEAWLAVAAPGW
ncbi:MAG TPA: ATP-binding protein [Myxococcaceae bacterium]|nr:ATP-binding protein [Myxococcaceae bacterium]